MTDVSTDSGPPPVFAPDGTMQGNLTSSQGQPPQPAGAPALAPQSPLAVMGPPPAPTPPPKYPALNVPPMPQQPQLQQNKEPPPDAKEYQKNAMGWASAFAVLGAIAGRFTRAPGGAALGAFGAALKGWQTGNLQAYQNAADEWEKQSKQALDNNKLVLEKYKLALENRKMNIDDQMSQIQLIATQYHDQIMYDAASSKNYTLVADLYDKGWRQTEKGYEYHAELSATNQEFRTKAEMTAPYWMAGEGARRLEIPEGQPGAMTAAQKAGVKQLIEIYGQKAQKGGQSGQIVAKENEERAARGEPPMTAQEEISLIQSIHPPRSAPAIALDTFKRDFQAKYGRAPNPDELTKFSADFTGQQSYARSAGTQGARVESAVNEVEQLIPQAVETSHAYLRGKVVPFNKIKNALNAGVSDPTFNDFELANFSLINAYTRAMNPQGVPRVHDRLEQHALGILSSAISPQAYDTQVRRLWKEVQASKTAVAKAGEGRTKGNLNAPVPGLDDQPAGDSGGWGKATVVGQ